MSEGSSGLNVGATRQSPNPPARLQIHQPAFPALPHTGTAVIPSHLHSYSQGMWGKGRASSTSAPPHVLDFHKNQWLCFPFSFHYMPNRKFVMEL